MNFDEKGVAKVQSSGFAQTDDQKMILLKKLKNWRFLTGLQRREEFEEGKNTNFEKYCCGLGRGSFIRKNHAVAHVLCGYPHRTLATA